MILHTFKTESHYIEIVDSFTSTTPTDTLQIELRSDQFICACANVRCGECPFFYPSSFACRDRLLVDVLAKVAPHVLLEREELFI